MRARRVIRIVAVCYAVFCAILAILLGELAFFPLPPGSVRLCGTFQSLQAMVAIFKAGLHVQQMRTAMP
jgi:hypothetical protein